MSKRKQRYWVETQAQDGSWNACAPTRSTVFEHKTKLYSKGVLTTDANQAAAFMQKVIAHCRDSGVGITGARVMQRDPNGIDNIYQVGF